MPRKLPPIHPGEILREEYMLPLQLSSNALARALEVTPARINEIVRERRGISADTALRLARYFGNDAQSWLNLQQRYRLGPWNDSVDPASTGAAPRLEDAAVVVADPVNPQQGGVRREDGDERQRERPDPASR